MCCDYVRRCKSEGHLPDDSYTTLTAGVLLRGNDGINGRGIILRNIERSRHKLCSPLNGEQWFVVTITRHDTYCCAYTLESNENKMRGIEVKRPSKLYKVSKYISIIHKQITIIGFFYNM